MSTLTRVEPAFGKHGQMTNDDAREHPTALPTPWDDGEKSSAAPAPAPDRSQNRTGISRLAPKTDPDSIKLRAHLARLRERTRRAGKSSRDSVSDHPTGKPGRRTRSVSGTSQVGRRAPVAALRTLSNCSFDNPPPPSGTNASNDAGPFQFDINTVFATSIDLVPMAAVGPQKPSTHTPVTAPARPRKMTSQAPVAARPSSDTGRALARPPEQKARQQKSPRNSARTTSAPRPGELHLVEPEPPTIEPYCEWFKRVVVRNRWMMWFATFYLHWLILLLLAALIVHGPENAASLLINATFAAEDDLEFPPFEIVTTEPEIQEVEEPEPSPAESEAPARMDEAQLDLADAILQDLVPQGSVSASDAPSEATEAVATNSASDQQTAHVDRAPAQAVREGSFSVWTEPPNPRPGEPYRIIIQVRLPEHVKTYSINDLQGVVVGTDGYRKPIPGFMQGQLPIVDGYARLAVPIVSADKKVCDTVFIRSRLLKETQKLLIEFL